MAIATLCSSSSHCPTLPTISLHTLPSFQPVKTQQPLQPNLPFPSSSPKFGVNLVCNDELIIAAAAQAAALASEAVQAARDATSAIAGTGEDNEIVKDGSDKNVLGLRRNRRKRRKELNLEYRNEANRRVLRGSFKSGRLNPTEESELCLYLKEGTRLEEANNRVMEAQEHFPSIKQFAHTIGLPRRSMDEVWCNTRESRERIVQSYRGLVVSIAADYEGNGLSRQDLVQEGSIGLLRGAEKFDPERGYKLSTYVYWWIKQAIIKAITRKSRLVRLPGKTYEMVAKVGEANKTLSKRLHRVPSYAETAEMLNVHVSTVRLVSERSRPPTSLDKAVTDHGCMTLQEIVAGPDEMTPNMMVKKQFMKQEVDKLLKTLSKREVKIVGLYFGLNGETPLSFEEIGKLLKLSRERVRQIYGIALSKLRQTNNVQKLSFYLV